MILLVGREQFTPPASFDQESAAATHDCGRRPVGSALVPFVRIAVIALHAVDHIHP